MKPVQTSNEMKLKLQEKYLPASYKQRLLDQWQRLTQSNQSMAEYIIKFNEFLLRCGENESDVVLLSRFPSGLREDLRREIIVRDISTLEQAYQLVQDLNRFHDFSFTRSTYYRNITPTRTLLSSPSLISPSLSPVLDLVTPLRNMMIKAKEFTASHLDLFNRIDVLSV